MAFDESQLVASAQQGNASAVERLLEHYYDYIFSICRKVTGNIDDANEATQETLISVVRNIPSFKSTAKFSTWVYRIATNAALDEIRKKLEGQLLNSTKTLSFLKPQKVLKIH